MPYKVENSYGKTYIQDSGYPETLSSLKKIQSGLKTKNEFLYNDQKIGILKTQEISKEIFENYKQRYDSSVTLLWWVWDWVLDLIFIGSLYSKIKSVYIQIQQHKIPEEEINPNRSPTEENRTRVTGTQKEVQDNRSRAEYFPASDTPEDSGWTGFRRTYVPSPTARSSQYTIPDEKSKQKSKEAPATSIPKKKASNNGSSSIGQLLSGAVASVAKIPGNIKDTVKDFTDDCKELASDCDTLLENGVKDLEKVFRDVDKANADSTFSFEFKIKRT